MTTPSDTARETISEWLGMFDPPPQIDFQQSEFLQAAIESALTAAYARGIEDASQWQPIETAPKDGIEFIARCGPEFPGFSCFWDGNAFVHYAHDDGLIAYPVVEWMPFPASRAALQEQER